MALNSKKMHDGLGMRSSGAINDLCQSEQSTKPNRTLVGAIDCLERFSEDAGSEKKLDPDLCRINNYFNKAEWKQQMLHLLLIN